MEVLYATDGFDAAVNAGRVMEKMGDRDRLDITVMSVTHRGIPRPRARGTHARSHRRTGAGTQSSWLAPRARSSSLRASAKGHTAEGHPGPEIVRSISGRLVRPRRNGRRQKKLGRKPSARKREFLRAPFLAVVSDDRSRGTAQRRQEPRAHRDRWLARGRLAQFADPSSTVMKVVSVAQEPAPIFFAAPGPSMCRPHRKGTSTRRGTDYMIMRRDWLTVLPPSCITPASMSKDPSWQVIPRAASDEGQSGWVRSSRRRLPRHGARAPGAHGVCQREGSSACESRARWTTAQ